MTIDIDKFKKLKALVIGDLMIDEYLWGSVDRISPEAPVPVVCVQKESQTLGGAGNVINNLVAMGAAVCAIGTAGTGKAGQMIFEKLEDLGIGTDGIISEPQRPTTRKTRVIASNQQVLRIDKEDKKNKRQRSYYFFAHGRAPAKLKIPPVTMSAKPDHKNGTSG